MISKFNEVIDEHYYDLAYYVDWGFGETEWVPTGKDFSTLIEAAEALQEKRRTGPFEWCIIRVEAKISYTDVTDIGDMMIANQALK